MPRSDYWIKIFDSLPGHWKTRHVQEAMGWSRFETVGFLTMFWLQVASDTPSGVLDGLVSVNDILKAIGLKDKTKKIKNQFFKITQALLECRLLEESGTGFILHDWEDGGGKLQKTRADDNARQRQRRTGTREEGGENCHGDVTNEVEDMSGRAPPEHPQAGRGGSFDGQPGLEFFTAEHNDRKRDSLSGGMNDGSKICHADVTHESKSENKKETPPYPPQAGGDFKFFEKMVLDTWTAECAASGRRTARDSKTTLGAGKVARALMAGELAAGDLAPSMRGFLALVAEDRAKATWDLNTYAKKPLGYLPKAAVRAAAPPPAPVAQLVTHRWRCDTCGREFHLPSPAGEGTPQPTRCIRGLIPGVKCPGVMSVVEKGIA